MFFFVWVRGTLLRLRYDQFMKFGWKILIPCALAWVAAVAVVQGVRQFTDVNLRSILIALSVLMFLGVVASLLMPEKKGAPQRKAKRVPFDAFAGGYPVPPLPGQKLPPSSRRARAVVVIAAARRDDGGSFCPGSGG